MPAARAGTYLGLFLVTLSTPVFGGLGSLLTERFVQLDRRATLVAPVVLFLALVAATGVATPELLRVMDAATTPVRIATAVGLLAPLPLAMGMPFAIGMRAASATPGVPTAFLWGINGATSVCASVLGVVIALFLGISAAFWAGALAYSLALASIVLITRAPSEPAPVASGSEAVPLAGSARSR